MDCSELDVLTFLSQPIRYKIPIYQRRYSWGNAQWKQLFSDILAIQSRKKHFLGSIVLTNRKNVAAYVTHQYVIDGQQRVITLSILLKALYDTVEEYAAGNDYAERQCIMDSNLVHLHDNSDNRFRVQPVGDDFSNYKALFSEAPGKGTSRIAQCYRYFRDSLEKEFVDKGKKLESLTTDLLPKLYFLVLTLQEGDDPQVIFESINATGLALSESDKIRNFILMKCSPELQKKYYSNYWEKIEKNTGADINHFIRYYLMAAKGTDARIKSLYEDFKEKWGGNNARQDAEAMLSEMLHYSTIYRKITIPNAFPYDPRNELSVVLYRLTSAKFLKTASPFLLKAIDYCKEQGREQDILPILKTIESFIARRAMCQINKNRDTSLFKPLHSNVMQLVTHENRSYPEALEIELMENKRTSRFPDDEELREKFADLQFYTALPKEMQQYLIARLEVGDAKEGEQHKEILEKFEKSIYSIEHIMPRKLTPAWAKELGPKFKETHDTYLHTLGNITITAYNSSYSNLSFSDKKNMDNGFNSSPLRLNASLKRAARWDEEAIEKRSKELFEKALELWPRSSEKPQQERVKDLPLNLNDRFEFTRLVNYSYKGKKYRGDSWTKAISELLDVLKKANPDNFFINEVSPIGWRDSIYGTDTNTKIKRLKKLFSDCGLDERDLIFSVQLLNENDEQADPQDYYTARFEGLDDEDYVEEEGHDYSV